MNQLTITWHGHSCFTIAANDYCIVLDPYAPGSVPGYAPLALEAQEVLCSHDHEDHNDRSSIALRPARQASPFTVSSLDTWHDDAQGALRGPNRIHILEAEGFRVAHLGDLGCELSPEQISMLQDLDALLIPIGGYYTIDANQAARLTALLNPQVAIPMHYRSASFGYPVLSELEAFTRQCSNVIVYSGNSLEISKDTKQHTAVLTLH